MSDEMSKSTKNVLELYLNDVFEYECEMKALPEEIVFIQSCIEKSVHRIVDEASGEIARRCMKRLQDEATRSGDDQRQQASVDTSHLKVVKVGSFYERSRNGFPDEFDLIFYVCKSHFADPTNGAKYASHLIAGTAPLLRETLSYSERCSFGGSRSLYFDKSLGKHGPAAYLQFIYKNSCTKPRVIHVDIVPAIKTSKHIGDIVNGEHNLSWYYKFVKENMIPKSFREQVLSCEYYLTINGRLSFTETEVHFMTNILSRKHLKLYRILKHLLNGDIEALQIFHSVIQPSYSFKGYCSYQIKTMMIYHHDECMNQQADGIGPCAIQVLKEICRNGDSGNCLTFLGVDNAKETVLLPLLKSLTQSLEKMKAFSGKYDYKSIKLNTLPSQFLNTLDKTDPKYETWFQYIDYLFDEKPSYDNLTEFTRLLKNEMAQ